MQVIGQRVLERLQTIEMLPEFRAALVSLAEYESAADDSIGPNVCSFLLTLYQLLGGTNEEHVLPFVEAWSMLRAMLSHLDHLQDGDIDAKLSPTPSHVPTQYNAAFAYYILATALLDDLDSQTIPVSRLLHLRRMWTDSLLCAASGQQRGLIHSNTPNGERVTLEHYQQSAEAKSGSIFGLAFGGAATLATDDLRLVRASHAIGKVYGTLLQFADDLLDASIDATSALTLPHAYAMAREGAVVPSSQELYLFWRQYIYPTYLDQVKKTVDAIAPTARLDVLHLFTVTFEKQPNRGPHL
ncbi:MAG: hypothetical protein NVS2B7_29830 [Herpetosiphon sp.]